MKFGWLYRSMFVMRRQFVRLLRLRNLLTITFLVILLYIVKTFNNISKTNIGTIDYFVPKSLKKIDWHNYTQIEYERKRQGIGEQGLPARLPKSLAFLEEQLYSVNGFNGALSDKIALNRSLPDIRHPGCKVRKYIESLPTVSVVVPFHNEHWSTLLRTAYSVLIRSPEFLIKEVFLVDDASTKDFLKQKLEDYLSKHLPKVKVVRLAQRSGLIAARLAGAARASADVLLFLDSHTEATVNWLPPLLEPIALSYRTVVCPYIDVIAYDTFEYRAQDEGARGAFDWELFYKRLPVLPRDQDNMPEPFQSPVMAGGLFAMSRKFFWELGGYDPGLDIWGGEQYELSFKIWQCGGRMVDAPCSRVGHIYRKFAPFPNPGHGDFVGRNYRRVAEVWMDEYAQYLYKRRPHYLHIDTGDISHQKKLREKLQCKSFRWFMTQIAFDLTAKYPPVEPEPFAEGRIRAGADGQLCCDLRRGEQGAALALAVCERSAAAEQHFLLSWHKDIRSKDRNMCWDVPDSRPEQPIILYSCHLGGGNQLWRYHPATKQLKHGGNENCLEWEASGRKVFINRCSGARAQQWDIDTVNQHAMARWDKTSLTVTGPFEDY
ncbi:PREDICTED: N-acetylgalactosaminyltransferase 6-like [Papilio polytes]|uniref:N-acetylgalactosaminyltransferase 6-like n=1 Tax=Papilio polytes TaxID=76194 RepID=UPI000675D5E1|nr:PREDICTED: N-acetylgalactosaminyltransferase 6-like [Papilio polytes]